MPALVAVAEHEGVRPDRLADSAIIDELPAGLECGAEERVGSAANQYASLLGEGEKLLGFVSGNSERLFVVDALPRFDSCLGNLVVSFRNGQVENDLDVWIGQDLIDATRSDAVLGSRFL